MIAWVTGGGTGIGRALAEQLYRDGARVIITGRRQTVLEETQRQLTQKPSSGELLAISGDASDPQHVRDVVAQVTQRWGVIDLLINNAGYNPVQALLETPPDDYRKYFEINCLSAIQCTTAVLPAMRQAGRGSIINISSIYGRWGTATSAPYSVSKFALAGYSESLQQALIGTPIHVMSVFPGFIMTDMTMPSVVPGTLRSKLGKSPQSIAKVILVALKNKQLEVYYPWYVPWALRLHRWFPLLANQLAQRVKR